MIKTIEVDVELSDFSDEDLIDEVESRELMPYKNDPALIKIWEEFRRRGDAPECLREYLYAMIGRTL